MINKNQEFGHSKNPIFDILVGALIGGLAGTVTILLLTPQPGKKTRMQIEKKRIRLYDRATEIIETVRTQTRLGGKKISIYGQQNRKPRELLHQDQMLASRPLESML